MDGALGIFEDGATPRDLSSRGLKQVSRWVIDMDAPGMREQIAAAVDRINASEEEAHILAEMELNTAEVWSMIPE